MNSTPASIQQEEDLEERMDPNVVSARWAATRASIQQRANRWRFRFEHLARRIPPVLLVVGLGVVAGLTGWLVQWVASRGCERLPFSFIDLELTFSGDTFAAMLRSASACRTNVALSMVTADVVFPAAYALFLCALFLWVERYRRFLPDEWAPGDDHVTPTPSRERPIPSPSLPFHFSLLVLAPFVAAALDIVLENGALALAALLAPVAPGAEPSGVVDGLVWLGSVAAALKWTVLGLFVLGLIGTFLRGPRGLVLWRVRFSALAVLLGSIPLLAIAQGQDILQRITEGGHPYVRIVAGVLVLAGAALAVWYSARVLALVRLTRDAERREDEWLLFFERNVPRMLGVAVLALAGAAFAKAGLAPAQFIVVVAASYLGTLALTRRNPHLLETIGRSLVPRRLRDRPRTVRRVGHGVLASALAVFVVWPSSVRPFAWAYDPGRTDQFALRLAAWLSVVAAWVLYVFVYHRRQLSRARAAAATAGGAPTGHDLHEELRHGYAADVLPPNAVRAAVWAGIVSGVLLALFTFVPVRFGRLLGPLTVVALAVANAVFIGSLLAYWGRKLRFPIVTVGLALAALFSRWNDNHDIRTVATAARPDTAARPGQLRARFRTWLATRAAEDTGTVPVVLVAAAGGGLRAAYWTSVVLATLQDRDSAFARHVFALSGVSGGSVGAGVFTAMARDLRGRAGSVTCVAQLRAVQSVKADVPAGPAPSGARVAMAPCARRFMSDDFLSPVLAKFVAPDLLQRFVPFPIRQFDRATALEQSWEQSYAAAVGDTTFAAPYLMLYRDEASVRGLPLLLLNTTHVETGRRYVTAPFNDEGAFLDARSVHRALGADMPVSTAMHNSARFAYVSPAGRLERRDGATYGFLVDGGYFENSGLATLGDVRREILLALGDTITSGDTLRRSAARRARLIVVYLCNDPIACRRDTSGDSSLTAARGLAAEWLSPLNALLATRDARGGFARAEMARAMGHDFYQLNVCETLALPPASPARKRLEVGRERVVRPALGWLLSRLARDWMDSSLTRGARSAPNGETESIGNGAAKTCRRSNADAMDSIVAAVGRR